MSDFPIVTAEIKCHGTTRKFRHFDTIPDRKMMEWIINGDSYPIFSLNGTPRTILDLGANVGAAAVMFHMQYPEARIDCFEPTPASFALLKENTADIPNITCYNMGVGAKAQNLYLRIHPVSGVMNSLFSFPQNDGAEYIEVPVTPVSALMPCDILKVDVEGMEFDIFQSIANRTREIGVVYTEIHNRHLRLLIDAIFGFTHSLCYAKISNPDQCELAFVRNDWFRWPDTDEMKENINEPT